MKTIDHKVSSGNVFADLGLPNADEHLLKAQLVVELARTIKRRRLTQAATAKLCGVRQPDISNMLRGEFRQFSVERLLRFMVALNHDVEIIVRPHRGSPKSARLRVVAGAAASPLAA